MSYPSVDLFIFDNWPDLLPCVKWTLLTEDDLQGRFIFCNALSLWCINWCIKLYFHNWYIGCHLRLSDIGKFKHHCALLYFLLAVMTISVETCSFEVLSYGSVTQRHIILCVIHRNKSSEIKLLRAYFSTLLLFWYMTYYYYYYDYYVKRHSNLRNCIWSHFYLRKILYT